jgi:porin
VEGPSIYPHTAVGGRFEVKPSLGTVLRVAVMDGVPVDRADGTSRVFAPGDGALIVGEFALLSRPDTAAPIPPNRRIGRGRSRSYTGKVAIGAWYYTASFPDLVDTLASGAPLRHQGSAGAYLIADQAIWSEGDGSSRVLSVFGQLGIGDSRVNHIGGYIGGGVDLAAPFANRSSDALGLAAAAALTGSHYARAQRALGTPAAAAETAVELTYLGQVGRRFAVQPDLQYVIHPGTSRATPNALVVGLEFLLNVGPIP